MKILPLLGQQLKDDDVIAVLDDLDMEVVYDFDRLHEGQPDRYWATSKRDGIQFGFDAQQTLSLIFLHVISCDDFTAFSTAECDLPLFHSITEAQTVGERQHIRMTKGTAEFLGMTRDWVCFQFETHSVHYEFRDDNLALITISRVELQTA